MWLSSSSSPQRSSFLRRTSCYCRCRPAHIRCCAVFIVLVFSFLFSSDWMRGGMKEKLSQSLGGQFPLPRLSSLHHLDVAISGSGLNEEGVSFVLSHIWKLWDERNSPQMSPSQFLLPTASRSESCNFYQNPPSKMAQKQKLKKEIDSLTQKKAKWVPNLQPNPFK